MATSTMADLFVDELRDVLSAEQQLVKAIPKMIKKASNPELVKALESHLEETRQQVERVQQAFSDTGEAARAKACKAMKGLIEEAESMLGEDFSADVLDSAIIACAQKIEHYEIATYGTLCAWAKALGYEDALQLLKQNIDEEENADKTLSEVAAQVTEAALASS